MVKSGGPSVEPWARSTPGRRDLLVAASLCILGFGLYGRSLDVPWYMDDVPRIVENAAIRSYGLQEFRRSTRPLVDWSFALNYRVHGLDVAGYHVVNIVIHVVASFLVYLLAKRAFRGALWRPSLAAFVFLAHPLQTQAVTYISQRYASLCALLVLAAVYSFTRACEALGRGHSLVDAAHVRWYLLGLAASLGAVYSKENGVLVPVLFLLFERFFLGSRRFRSSVAYMIPVGVAFVAVAFQLGVFAALLRRGAGLAGIMGAERMSAGVAMASTELGSWGYLLTQLEVFWRYLRLFVLPVGQVFDYAYPVRATPGVPTVLAAGGILALVVLAIGLRRCRPQVAFGIFWLLVALAPESSVVVLDTYFEHRMYLPMFGLAVAAAAVPGRRALVLLAVFVLACSALTLRRNEQWRDPAALFAEDLGNGSLSYRSALGLADAWYKRGEPQKARAAYETFARRATAVCASTACQPKYLLNLSVALERLGRPEEALAQLRQVIALGRGDALVYYNAGVALYGMGELREALDAFDRARRLAPADADALFNYGFVSLQLGDEAAAAAALAELRALDTQKARALQDEIAAAGEPRPKAGVHGPPQ